MKFTPSATYLREMNAAGHYLTWSVLHKRTTVLSEGLTSGTWVNSTSRVNELPEIGSRIEYDLGEFTADSVNLTGRDIAWWKANVFYPSANLITNGTFDSDASGWTVSTGTAWIVKNTTSPMTGAGDGKVTTDGAGSYTKSNTFAITSGVTYKVSFRFRKTAASGRVFFRINNSADDTYILGSPSIDIEQSDLVETVKTATFTAEESVTGNLVFYAYDSTACEFYIDDVSIAPVIYNELKITCTLGVATDVVNVFHGWIQEQDIEYNELMDSVSFTAFTVEDLASQFPITMVSTQYIQSNVDGLGNNGIILPRLPGVYIINAAVNDYPLLPGVHTITYNFGSLRLDDGEYNSSTTTLVNGDGTQKVELYYDTLSVLEVANSSIEETIIVVNKGTTLPRQPYYGLSASQYLTLLYNTIGITDVTIDTMAIKSHDGTNRLSKYNLVGGVPTNEYKAAVCANGATLYVGVGNRVYRKSGDSYVLVCTVTSASGTNTILRLWYNSGGSIYIYYSNTVQGQMFNWYSLVDGSFLVSECVVNAGGDVGYHNVSMIDYNYTGSSYKRGLIFAISDKLYFIDENTMTVSTACTLAFSVSNDVIGTANFHYQRTSAGKLYVWVKMWDNVSPGSLNVYYHNAYIDSTGNWNDGSYTPARHYPAYSTATYNAVDDKIYYLTAAADGSACTLRSHPHGDETETVVVSDINAWENSAIYTYGAYSYIVTTGQVTYYYPMGGVFKVISANTVIDSVAVDFYTYAGSMVYADRLYIVDRSGLLWQYYSTINLFINDIFIDSSIRDIITNIFRAFNLVGITNAKKQAKIYRRGDDYGEPVGSGESVSISASIAADITQREYQYKAYDVVEIGSGEYVTTYDGMNFNSISNIQNRKLSVTSDIISPLIMDDIAKHFYKFFCHDRCLYVIPLGNYPALNYECFDGATISLSSQKISASVFGIIYAISVNQYGQMALEVMV